jgi:hypothetical protein
MHVLTDADNDKPIHPGNVRVVVTLRDHLFMADVPVMTLDNALVQFERANCIARNCNYLTRLRGSTAGRVLVTRAGWLAASRDMAGEAVMAALWLYLFNHLAWNADLEHLAGGVIIAGATFEGEAWDIEFDSPAGREPRPMQWHLNG